MEKQELLSAFTALQDRVAQLDALQINTQQSQRFSQIERASKQAQYSPISDLVTSGFTMVIVGNFVADHFAQLSGNPLLGLPALAIFAMAVVLTNFAVRQLIALSSLDYAKPIADAQMQILNVRKLKFQVTQWTFLLALPAWFVFPLFLGQLALGPGFVTAISSAWIVGNVVFGVAMVPLVNWGLTRSKYAGALQDTIAGKHVIEAEEAIKEVSAFRQS